MVSMTRSGYLQEPRQCPPFSDFKYENGEDIKLFYLTRIDFVYYKRVQNKGRLVREQRQILLEESDIDH